MPSSASPLLDASTVTAFLEKLCDKQEKHEELPLHYQLDGERLLLQGTNNLGEMDAHNLLRFCGGELHYEGPVDIQAHLDDVAIHAYGENGIIRVMGYVCGASGKKQARLVSEESSVFLGDPGHPERKLVLHAHIEAGNGITVYKRQLIHSQLINHNGDTIIRGQNIQGTRIETPALNLSASLCREMTVRTRGDVMIKCSEAVDSEICAVDGDIYLCSGRVRNCRLEAKYDIELNGSVDAFTLENAISHQGAVRHDGIVVARASKGGGGGASGKAPAKRPAASQKNRKATG